MFPQTSGADYPSCSITQTPVKPEQTGIMNKILIYMHMMVSIVHNSPSSTWGTQPDTLEVKVVRVC